MSSPLSTRAFCRDMSAKVQVSALGRPAAQSKLMVWGIVKTKKSEMAPSSSVQTSSVQILIIVSVLGYVDWNAVSLGKA